MSFKSVLSKIGHVVMIGERTVAPLAPAIEAVPVVGTVFGIAFNAIALAEQLFSSANSGAKKKDLVVTVVNAVHPGLDQDKLGADIDALVAILNLMNKNSQSPTMATPLPAK